MQFRSILFADKEPELLTETPVFFHDLQLDYLLERILEPVKGYQTEKYYYTFPREEKLILFRQQVGKDMESEELCTVLRRFCHRLKESRKIYNYSLKSEGEMQAAAYHLQAASLYWEAVLELEKKLGGCSLESEGMLGLAGYVKQHLAELRERGFAAALKRADEFFSGLSFQLSVDTDKLMVEESVEFQKNYFEELAELLGQEPERTDTGIQDIFPEPLEPSYLEQVLVRLLKKSRPEVFREIKEFYKCFPVIYSDTLLRFEEEVQFYLSFQNFKLRTKAKGYSMTTPVISREQGFSGRGVYDIALVWKQEDSSYQVVANEFTMKNRPSFFVVTGPNQGGKTTFARSMGQAVYFTLMGLSVNAECFRTPLFQGISTHFEAEETLQSNSGKLKEEINRLIPMMAQNQNRCSFVILNELFTTATTHDAMIMGRKVMESFLRRECYGIYVTHIQELAEETEEIISLVAQLAPGEESRRTYRMLPMKAQGFGYSEALVKKFRLDYADIVRRLS
ncbi:MAG: hypothetical protein J6J42_10490 [Lachnospiraceae bacterium]|nr:hypothetical protein [Lachnospiraceae bacterium]